eukprot:CAMPEP_0177760148 /NCGR_PEP_ID=MMETSP0491_2-20121128/5109_1 /TAXON_ID=63592 /ORGANISM="Tetraselmis chuii, Strain PLY429" /LENGTH=69 /DNA_ID=CAMNT_0019276021 /DNA_START=1641 /DNA_END=1847 /DNA_ORIENTATION=-
MPDVGWIQSGAKQKDPSQPLLKRIESSSSAITDPSATAPPSTDGDHLHSQPTQLDGIAEEPEEEEEVVF